MIAPHRLELRVYYEDTDFSGFVYHAGYLRFLERGRTEFLRALGITQSVLHREADGLVFVVARLSIDYQRPALMDDVLIVETTVTEARGPVIKMRQAVKRQDTRCVDTRCVDTRLVTADVTVAAVRNGRPVRLPPTFKAAFDGAISPE